MIRTFTRQDLPYEAGKLVGTTEGFRLYLYVQVETGKAFLFQVAQEGQNGLLDRFGYVLNELKQNALHLEKEYAKVREDPKVLLNYQLGFPELVDTFLVDGTRINVLGFRNVENPAAMVPIARMVKKDHLRVDMRTSVWIMGKLLKLLVFAHSQGISVGRINAGNVLLEPDQHYAVLFDWTASQFYSNQVPPEIRKKEISQAAKTVIVALGGNVGNRMIPDDGDEGYGRYRDHLLRLSDGAESNPSKAHERFYKLVDGLWQREFYQFTTYQMKGE